MRAFGIADAAIISALVCGAAATVPMLARERPDRVVVYRQNAVAAEYPLGADAAFTVNGKNGPLDIEIKNGAARIVRANCPRAICKQSGAVNTPYGRLICAPNNILIQIQSSKGDARVDGVTY